MCDENTASVNLLDLIPTQITNSGEFNTLLSSFKACNLGLMAAAVKIQPASLK